MLNDHVSDIVSAALIGVGVVVGVVIAYSAVGVQIGLITAAGMMLGLFLLVLAAYAAHNYWAE